MASKKEPEIYVANTTYAVELDGVPTVVHRGERVRKGHALLKQNPEYYEPIDDGVEYDVIEEATTAPRGSNRAK